MARGGRREGSGGKSAWKHGKTKTVRVPEALSEKILEIARVLDEDGLDLPVTGSKVLDLAGVAIYSSKDGPTVRLMDLVRAGYEILPDRLARSLKIDDTKVDLRSEIDSLLGAQNE